MISNASTLRTARLLDAQADLRHLLGNSARSSELDPAVAQVIEHGDLFDDPPRLVVLGDHAHDAKSGASWFAAPGLR
jgi:hypothetical protein